MKLININDDFKERFSVVHEKIRDEIGLKILIHPNSLMLFQNMIEHDHEYHKFKNEPFEFKEKDEIDSFGGYGTYSNNANGFCIGSQIEVKTETLHSALVDLFFDLNYKIKEFRFWDVEKRGPKQIFEHKAVMFYAFLEAENHYLRLMIYKGSIYEDELKQISEFSKIGNAEPCSLIAFDVETLFKKNYFK